MPRTSPVSAEQELNRFIDAYHPAIAALAREALIRLRRHLPGAVGVVSEDHGTLTIAFGPTARTSDAVVALSVYPRWVSLFFLHGAALPDPAQRLGGSGRRARHVVLQSAADVDDPAIVALLAASAAAAPTPFETDRPDRLVVRSASKQRPRPAGARRIRSAK
jgi:hypothetical protein